MSLEELKNIPFTKPLNEDEALDKYADRIKKLYNFKTLDDTKEILCYQDGIYQYGGDVIISTLCQNLIPECDNHKVNEVIGIIKRTTWIKREKFNQTKLICLNNCLFDLETHKRKDHTPDEFLMIKLPFDYDPKAKCPKFLKFLRECHNEDYENIITCIEAFANIFTLKEPNFEISIINYGVGANGKSTFLKIMRGVIGKENTACKSIHSFENERFAMVNLDGKLANIYGDISSKELSNLGAFKQLVSGESLTVEKKNKDAFLMESFAKHFFSCNEMPDIKDNSDGAFRRIYVIEWKNQFLPNKNRIDDYDKIILQDEKAGIFNLLLHNLTRLINNKGFTHKQSISSVRDTIKLNSDKILEFVKECLIEDPNGWETKDNIHQVYAKFANSKNYEVYAKNKLSSKLPTYGFIDISKKIKKKTYRCWVGYRLNKENDWVKINITGLDGFC